MVLRTFNPGRKFLGYFVNRANKLLNVLVSCMCAHGTLLIALEIIAHGKFLEWVNIK